MKQDSPEGIGGHGCGSVEEEELCGPVAVKGRGRNQYEVAQRRQGIHG